MEKYPEWLKDSVTTVYLERALKESISYLPEGLLSSIKMPKSGKNSGEERIDAIKRKKGSEVQSSIIAPLSKILEDEVFSEEDEE